MDSIDFRVAARSKKATVIVTISRLNRLCLMVVLLLLGFLVVCAGVDFCHHHDIDDGCHDFCPACQWNNLRQDDYSGAAEICDILESRITPIRTRAVTHELAVPSDVSVKTIPSRGPPCSA